MNSLEIYKHKFETKIQFYYFVHDSKLGHFQKPLENKIEPFSINNNSLDKKLIKELDLLAEKFNGSDSNEKRVNSAKYAVTKIVEILISK